MKLITKKEMLEKNKVKRVLTEREVLATADHPFVVTMYYSFQTKTKIAFVMQFCGGGEFWRVIQRQPLKCLTEEQAKFYSAEVLLALEYLHMKGFIYRDLKPENILMHESGHIKLTDFDLSKSSAPPQPRLFTKTYSGGAGIVAEPDFVTNSFVGTEEYLAPEVVKGTGHNASVDWWTFGILIYEMLYGVTPFRGVNRDSTFENINKKQISFPEHKRGGISKDCKRLMKSLTHRDPRKRLGAVGGAVDIKDHPFYKGIKWQLLRHQSPPIVPKLSPETTERPVQDVDDHEESVSAQDLSEDHPFKPFETVDKSDRDQQDRKIEASEKHRKAQKKKPDQ